MTAWRVRLKRIWYLLIISPAFLEAFCNEVKRVHVSSLSVVSKEAWDGRRTHVHGVATGRDLAGVTLAESPVEGVGEGVLAEVAKNLLINLESGEVGWIISMLASQTFDDEHHDDHRTYGKREWPPRKMPQ